MFAKKKFRHRQDCVFYRHHVTDNPDDRSSNLSPFAVITTFAILPEVTLQLTTSGYIRLSDTVFSIMHATSKPQVFFKCQFEGAVKRAANLL